MSDYKAKQAEDLARFRRDTKNHRMTIIFDDKDFRHIRVADPDTSAYHFNITTTPGYLMFTGDMGAFVFSRLRDMFEFHRINWDHYTPTIDYDYWAQKVDSHCRDGLYTFDDEYFKECAVYEFRQHVFPHGVSRLEVWDTFKNDVLSGVDDEREAVERMSAFSYYDENTGDMVFPFQDFWEYNLRKHSFRFKWACWAIASTVHDYDRGGDRFTRQERHDMQILKIQKT